MSKLKMSMKVYQHIQLYVFAVLLIFPRSGTRNAETMDVSFKFIFGLLGGGGGSLNIMELISLVY